MQDTYSTAIFDQIESLTSYQSADGGISILDVTCVVTHKSNSERYILERNARKNWFTMLCKIMHFTLHLHSLVMNNVCSVNTSLIDNDLFHLVSEYC